MSSCAVWRSLTTGGLWWPGVEGLKWSFLLLFFYYPSGFPCRLVELWMFFQPNVSRRVWAWIHSAGRKEGRPVGRLVGWLVWTEGNEASCRTKTKKKKKKRCEGFKCQWLLHQLLAALVAADISPDGRSASLLFNVALLRFVYLFIFFLFCNLQSHNFFVFCWLFSVLNVQVLYLQIFQIPFL